MGDTLKIELIRDGRTHWETEARAELPQVDIADPSGIADFSLLQTKAADGCIYCGSNLQLSREHILAYALGGKATVPRGSCEECRKITHAFETAVLRGPMRMVRYIQGMPSGTKHKDVPNTIPFNATINDNEVTIDAPRNEAPILLPFPLFDPPGYLESRDELRLCGAVIGSFGADLNEFGKKHGAQELHPKLSGNDVTAFARLIAKTAYANAYVHNLLQRVKDKSELVQAMMKKPNTMGRFVGTVPEPHKKYPGLQHRISTHIMLQHRLLYSEVQLFASAGAPSYIVVLGTLNDDDSIRCVDDGTL